MCIHTQAKIECSVNIIPMTPFNKNNTPQTPTPIPARDLFCFVLFCFPHREQSLADHMSVSEEEGGRGGEDGCNSGECVFSPHF